MQRTAHKSFKQWKYLLFYGTIANSDSPVLLRLSLPWGSELYSFLISSNGHSGNPVKLACCFSPFWLRFRSLLSTVKILWFVFHIFNLHNKNWQGSMGAPVSRMMGLLCWSRVLHSTVTTWNNLAEGMKFSIPSYSGCCSETIQKQKYSSVEQRRFFFKQTNWSEKGTDCWLQRLQEDTVLNLKA